MDERAQGRATGEDSGPCSSSADLSQLRPLRLWGGPGRHASCALCRAPISAEDTDYEVEGKLGERIVSLHFHRACYDLWNTQRLR